MSAPPRRAEAEPGGKLLLTGGVGGLEGGSGGGLATWALIGGNETSRGVGGSVHATYVKVRTTSFARPG